MTLLVPKQGDFALAVCDLIKMAHQMGYLVTLSEAWRSPETCALYAKEGKGIANSNHISRLAMDLVLCSPITFVPCSAEAYRELGEWWESKSDGQYKRCWGGRFKSNDIYHFSFENDGVQ